MYLLDKFKPIILTIGSALFHDFKNIILILSPIFELFNPSTIQLFNPSIPTTKS
ncbi:hypothetical protein A33Q_0091 [Indibacter alkaliphilus LW1]|uniref:Uncharacterized protein n=1 Tax=Indibacter alkaliphilus (strain CCUG 57479 / KCTC 22604 / LW1) TaxID=1189612 RepID=S2DT90_INDAL|nr:hypothetical protein A33Q_0091 [Indibacter alkaliphilus LW1]